MKGGQGIVKFVVDKGSPEEQTDYYLSSNNICFHIAVGYVIACREVTCHNCGVARRWKKRHWMAGLLYHGEQGSCYNLPSAVVDGVRLYKGKKKEMKY